MTDDVELGRRAFLFGTAGAAATGALAGGAAAQEGSRPDWGGWLEDIDGGYTDARGQSEVTVGVGVQGNGGAFAFEPAGLWVDPGTTVVWEWTGEGGGHNVVAEEGPADLDSGETVSEAGVHYEHTFEEGESGITNYVCEPHRGLGMKGAVAVGDSVPTVEDGGGGGDGGGGDGGGGDGGGGDGGGGTTETVVVGPGGELVFEPETLEIEAGTTVFFEWDSDNHNIVVDSQPDGADWQGTPGAPEETYDTGYEYEHTFETTGTYEYACEPHRAAGMLATVEVVEELAEEASDGAGGPPAIPDSAKTLGVASIIGMLSTLGLAYFFMRFGGGPREE